MQNRIYPLHITLIDIPRVFENSLHGGRRRQDRIFEKTRVQNRDITAVAAKVRRNNASQIPKSAGDKNFFRTHLKIPFRLRYGFFGCGLRLCLAVSPIRLGVRRIASPQKSRISPVKANFEMGSSHIVCAKNPPSTGISMPVTKPLACGLARKTVAPASSSGSPKRPIGVCRKIASARAPGAPSSLIRRRRLYSAGIQPGVILLTRTPLPAHSRARYFVRFNMTDLDAEYATIRGTGIF